MTYLFFVQGEGRGHLTQALTMKARLESRGHKIAAVIAGPSPDYKLPAFFEDQFKDKLIRTHSPNFVVDKKGEGINMPASVIKTIKEFRLYGASIKEIRKIVSEKNPDIIINFYDPLAGIYYRLYNGRVPLFCVGHQYFIQHPAFRFPRGRLGDRVGLKFYNWLTAPRQGKKIALSFTEANDLKTKRLHVCPPLIRQNLKDQTPNDEDFVLVYMLNSGYSRQIINWSEKNPHIKIEAFWNRPHTETTVLNDNLLFHNLHGDKFINRLANCSAYISTAGFESIAEAAYLQKKIMVVPTKRHFEQRCNAKDAERAGIAIRSKRFDLSPMISGPKTKTQSNPALRAFKDWVDQYNDKIINIIELK